MFNRNHAVKAVLLLALGSFVACSAERVPPKTLVDARADFVRVRDGVATQLDPTDLHEADLALRRAERAWRDSPDDLSTVDLALIADRKALIAQAEADALQAKQDAEQARQQLETTRAAQFQSAQGQLSQTRQALGQTEQVLGQTQVQLQQQQAASAAQQQKLRELEAKLKDAWQGPSSPASCPSFARWP